MRALCPHCHAEESRCPEKLPACRERGAERRRLYAATNGFESTAMRASREQREIIEAAVLRALAPVLRERDAAERRCEVLRAENERLRAALAKHAKARIVDPHPRAEPFFTPDTRPEDR